VAGGPGRDIKLTKTRVTIGTFVASGEEFKIIDHYTEPRAAHMMLEHAWVGTTEYHVKINYEGANIVASTRWADWASDEEIVGFDAGASARPHVGDSEKGQLKMFEEKGNPDAKASTHRALLSGSSATRTSCRWAVARAGVYRVGHLSDRAVQRLDRWWSQI
jgi:hypothetical protein